MHRMRSLSSKDFWKAVGIGIVTAVLLSGIMVPALKLGVSPLPKPLSLAFAETLFGTKLPLAVGLLFHVAWVTLFSVVYVWMFRYQMTFMRALGLAAVLWALVLVFFFPFVGWGFFGLAIGPQLAVAAAVPHVMFAFFVWGLSRLAYQHEHEGLAH